MVDAIDTQNPFGTATQPAPEPRKRRMFSSSSTPVQDVGPTTSLPQELNVINTRLRLAEERFSDLRQRLQVIEQNFLLVQKRLSGEMRSLADELKEFKRTVSEVENKMVLMIKELQLTAKQEDVGVLKRYVEMWNPINFVTASQVERIAREVIDAELSRIGPEPPVKQQAPKPLHEEINEIFDKKQRMQRKAQSEEKDKSRIPRQETVSKEDAEVVDRLLKELEEEKEE